MWIRAACWVVYGSLALAVAAPAPVSAHDIHSAATEPAARVIADALAATPYADTRTRGVIYSLYLWPAPRRLTVCFMDGSARARAATVAAMRQWRVGELTEGRLDFDFGTRTDGDECAGRGGDIRITFTGGRYWSYIGAGSIHPSVDAGPSLFLGGLDQGDWSAENDRIVIHETGHALGLHHEHQHPEADCADPWDEDWIFENYAWQSREEMRAEFARLRQYYWQGQRAYTFLTYDRLSVMHYAFPPRAYKADRRARCMTPRNAVPSAQDFRAIQAAYRARSAAETQRTRGAQQELLADPRYAALRDFLNR